MDKITSKVLKNVLDFGLRSTRKIGKDLGVSHQTVKVKLEKLEKDGVLEGFYPQVKFERLGFIKENVFIKLRQFDSKKFDKAVKIVTRKPFIVNASRVKGSYDLILTACASNLQRLHELEQQLRDELRDKLDIEKWDVNIVVEEVKTRTTSSVLEGDKKNEKPDFTKLANFKVLGRR